MMFTDLLGLCDCFGRQKKLRVVEKPVVASPIYKQIPSAIEDQDPNSTSSSLNHIEIDYRHNPFLYTNSYSSSIGDSEPEETTTATNPLPPSQEEINGSNGLPSSQQTQDNPSQTVQEQKLDNSLQLVTETPSAKSTEHPPVMRPATTRKEIIINRINYNSTEVQPTVFRSGKGCKVVFALPFKKAFKPLTGDINEMPNTFILLRHAEGEHNVADKNGKPQNDILDPILTEKGLKQCKSMSEAAFMTPDNQRMMAITHIVASPMRRTLQTALIYFAPLLAAKPDMKIMAMPILIERGVTRASTGSDLATLKEEFKGDPIDFSLLKEGWEKENLTTEPSVLKERAVEARKQLFAVGEEEGQEWTGKGKYIAVVSHGGFLRYVAQTGNISWENCGFTEYCFEQTEDGHTPTDKRFNLVPIPEVKNVACTKYSKYLHDEFDGKVSLENWQFYNKSLRIFLA